LQSRLLNKLLALAIALLLLAPLVFGAIYFSSRQAENAVAELEALDRYDRFRSVAAYDPAKLAAAASEANLARYFLGSGSPAVVSASLQARLRELAQQRRVEIVQASDLKSEPIGTDMVKLGVRLELAGPFQGVHEVLQQIEASVPWLFLDNVQIRSGFFDASSMPVEPPMTVSLDVWGVVPLNASGPAAP
jgi:hypothetical protein